MNNRGWCQGPRIMGQGCMRITYCRKDLQPQEKEAFSLSFLFFIFPYGVQIPHVQPRNLTLYGDIIHTGCAPYIRFIN